MLDSMVQNLMFLSAPGGRPCRMVGQVAGRSLAETGRARQSQTPRQRQAFNQTIGGQSQVRPASQSASQPEPEPHSQARARQPAS